MGICNYQVDQELRSVTVNGRQAAVKMIDGS